jgi:putative membrane protein
MRTLANFLVVLVAAEHFAFLALEMFFWQQPLGMRVFHTTPEFAAQSAALAANQGLYNGFLAAGLLWSLVDGARGFALKLFFLGCVIVAGVYGGLSAIPSILYVQGAPAALALLLVLATARKS